MSADLPQECLQALRGTGTVFIAELFDDIYEDPEPAAEWAEVSAPRLPDGNWVVPFVHSEGERFPIDHVPSDPRFTVHWEGELDGGGVLFERGPDTNDVEEAIAWGRARSRRVLVRLGLGDYQHYSAGEERILGEDLTRGVLPWPPEEGDA